MFLYFSYLIKCMFHKKKNSQHRQIRRRIICLIKGETRTASEGGNSWSFGSCFWWVLRAQTPPNYPNVFILQKICAGSDPHSALAAKEKIGKYSLWNNEVGLSPGWLQGWRGRSCASPSTHHQLNHGIIKAGKGLQGHKTRPLTKHQPTNPQNIPPHHPDMETGPKMRDTLKNPPNHCKNLLCSSSAPQNQPQQLCSVSHRVQACSRGFPLPQAALPLPSPRKSALPSPGFSFPKFFTQVKCRGSLWIMAVVGFEVVCGVFFQGFNKNPSAALPAPSLSQCGNTKVVPAPRLKERNKKLNQEIAAINVWILGP